VRRFNDWARIRSDFHRPRLFQWIPQNKTNMPQLMLPSASGANISRKPSSHDLLLETTLTTTVFHITARKVWDKTALV
jgi:hypothetical protein